VPVGNTTALGKRIESLAPVGSTAISASTAALVDGEFELRELGEFDVKGAGERHRMLELVGPGPARTRLEALAATRGLSRFVGRDAERTELESALEQALDGDGRAIGIVGDPGVGKSRLVREFGAGCVARGVAVNSSACVAHGRYVPFLPVLALYRDFFEIDERDAPEISRERIASAILPLEPDLAEDMPLLFEFLGVPDPDQPLAPLDPVTRRSRLLAVATRALTARNRDAAAVLVVEDLHWIDDASDAFLEQLVEAVVGTRMLVICTYRPEYDDAWTSAGPNTRLSLGPLDADATDDLLTELLGRDRSLEGLAAVIEARTAGNPFFVEEVVQALVESCRLSGERGDYRLAAELEALILPPTVQAGLAARIDRLPERAKALVETMAVIGQEIPGPLLSGVSDLSESELAETVEALASAQWVVPRGLGRSREYTFKHPLTQEVAYGSQLSGRRARAHRTVAAAIERTYPDGLDERAALLAHHYEAAGDELAGARWHARAATWAEVASPADAMRHWRRVRHLTSALDPSPERDELAATARVGILSLAWRLGVSQDETAALHAEVNADVERFPAALFYAGSLMHSGREREGLEGFRQAARAAVATGDPGLALTVSTGVAYASWIAGSLSEALAAIDRALPLAAGDPTTGSGLAFVCPLAHAYGDRGQCIGYMGELEQAHQNFGRAIEMAREHDDPETQSAAHAKLALLEAEVANYEAALSSAAQGLAIAERAGNAVHIVACSVPAAAAEAGVGRFADALARAESNLATIRQQRIGLYFEPLLLATIARSKLALDEPDDALAAAEEAVQIADARGLTTCALSAPIALAQVLIASRGAAGGERIDIVLARALRVARESRARVFEPQIRRELTALGRLHGDEITVEREQARAERMSAETRSGTTDGVRGRAR
jgi:tetratricopeptide (TPR) repeat protein